MTDFRAEVELTDSGNRPAAAAPLAEWLAWLESIHPVSIDMGLERVSAVAERLALRDINKPLVLVGGTNGKGSTVAMLSAIYMAAGFRVGAYTSPHISDFRERITLNGQMADERAIVEALAFVESGREPQTLTYFEYTTLAAMRVFLQADCDVLLFEVGLGGRLDATNIWDADCSVVTSIALDHESYLGTDVSVIATEKAAIARRGKTLVLGEVDPPESLFTYVAKQGIKLRHIGAKPLEMLPESSLNGDHQRRNAGCAVAVVDVMQARLPVAPEAVQVALNSAYLPARFERLNLDGVDVVMDVAHNPAGAAALCHTWKETFGNTQAQLVFAALDDKDIAGIVNALSPIAAHWHCVALQEARAGSLDGLAKQITSIVQSPVSVYTDTRTAWQQARNQAQSGGQVVLVAGSFHTIEAVRLVAKHEE